MEEIRMPAIDMKLEIEESQATLHGGSSKKQGLEFHRSE